MTGTVRGMLALVPAVALTGVMAMVSSGACAQGGMAGAWDATMMVGEHTLPFTIDIPSMPGREATISIEGVRTVSASAFENGDELRIDFPRHNAHIRATRVGDRLYGEWQRERSLDGRVTIERLEISAARATSKEAPVSLGEQAVEPLPLRWISEPDDCGSAHAYTICCDRQGAVVARTVAAEGRIVSYVGRWSEESRSLMLRRFDGEEAEVIVASREGAGPFVGRYWLGGHMPLPWVVHPIVMAVPTGPVSESGGTIAYP